MQLRKNINFITHPQKEGVPPTQEPDYLVVSEWTMLAMILLNSVAVVAVVVAGTLASQVSRGHGVRNSTLACQP